MFTLLIVPLVRGTNRQRHDPIVFRVPTSARGRNEKSSHGVHETSLSSNLSCIQAPSDTLNPFLGVSAPQFSASFLLRSLIRYGIVLVAPSLHFVGGIILLNRRGSRSLGP